MAMRDKIEHAIQNQPCTVKDLKNKFGGDRGADRKVMEAVDQLVHEAVICQRQGVFFTVRSGRADKALLCKVVKLGKNFAFVMLEDGTSDIFIPGRFTRGAMPGDKVLVEKFAHPRVEGSDEGEILAVLEEKNSLVGTMHRMEGRLKFVPDDCPAISMQVMRDCEGSAKDGDKVAVEILLRGNRQEDHRVGVAMRFGSCDEAKRCAKALLYAQDIRNRFPDKVRDEAKKLDNAEVSAADCEGRMDLRALPIFTIDSAETKDIDDAISLTKTPDGGFELGVHIADVSNYVKPGSELDNEAFNRATSVYYADQVVPMLPKQLSNGICSLNEGVLRLAFSCLMRLDKDGNLTDYRFVKSVIRSRVKGVYSEINALLAGSTDDELTGKYHEVLAAACHEGAVRPPCPPTQGARLHGYRERRGKADPGRGRPLHRREKAHLRRERSYDRRVHAAGKPVRCPLCPRKADPLCVPCARGAQRRKAGALARVAAGLRRQRPLCQGCAHSQGAERHSGGCARHGLRADH